MIKEKEERNDMKNCKCRLKKLNWKIEDSDEEKLIKMKERKKRRICRKRIMMIIINIKVRKETNDMKTCKCHVGRQI